MSPSEPFKKVDVNEHPGPPAWESPGKCHMKLPMFEFTPVLRSGFVVTSGALADGADGELAVSQPVTRAVVRDGLPQAARLEFVLHGRSDGVGVYERFGLKLRAKNSCNVLYIMWQFAPVEAVIVKLKSNPGLVTHEECGTAGYLTLARWNQSESTFPTARDGAVHVLQATLAEVEGRGYTLSVQADTFTSPDVGLDFAELQDINGPCGFRADNVNVTFHFFRGD